MASRAVANEVMSAARLNAIVEHRQSILNQSGMIPSTGAKTADVNVGYLEIPSVAYPSIVDVDASLSGALASGSAWIARLGWDTASDPGSTSTSTSANSIQREHLDNPTTFTMYRNANLSGKFLLAANTAAWVRLLLVRTSGTFTLSSPFGNTINVHRIEVFPAA